MLFLARANKEARLEECYNLFEKYDWDLTKFKNDTDLFIEDVRMSAREYAETVLNETLTKEQVWCLMPRNIRLLFNDYNTIIEEMLKEKIINRNQLLDIDWMSNNLRTEIRKFCYDIAEEYKWINTDIDEYCAKRSILPLSLKNLARNYTLEDLNLDEEKREAHRKKKLSYRKDYNLNEASDNSIGGFAKLFMKLSEIDDTQEIIRFLNEVGKDYSVLRNEFFNFVSSYGIADNVRDDLYKKIKIYQDYLANNRKIEQEKIREEKKDNYLKDILNKAIPIINGYVYGQYESVDKYCNSINLDKKIFDKYLSLVKENDEKTYNEYMQHEEKIKNQVRDDLVSRTLKVIDMMKNGVVEDGVKREFDLTDYYRYLPLGFDKMLRIVRDYINPEDYRNLGMYIGTIKNDKELSENDINNIYSMKTTVGVQFDKENKAIPGTGREITKEEKQNIINYLKTNNIPVTNKTYNIIYRRWLSGELALEEEKDKTK